MKVLKTKISGDYIESDVTGRTIKRAEQYIIAFGKIHIKVDEIQELEKLLLLECQDYYNIKSRRTEDKICFCCGEMKTSTQIILKGKKRTEPNNSELKIALCKEKICQVLKSIKEDIFKGNVDYYNKKGILIFRTISERRDTIDGKILETGSLIICLNCSNFPSKITTRIQNLEKLIRKLECKNNEYSTKKFDSCNLCEEKETSRLYTENLCEGCMSEIKNKLEKYKKENKKKIISEVI